MLHYKTFFTRQLTAPYLIWVVGAVFCKDRLISMSEQFEFSKPQEPNSEVYATQDGNAFDGDNNISDNSLEHPISIDNSPNRSNPWIMRHWRAVGLGLFALSGAYLASNPSQIVQTKNEIAQNYEIGYIFPVTEALAWGGAATMLASAWSHIGNPLTVKKRLSQIKHDMNDNTLFRTGWALGALGAIGTSTAIVAGAVFTLPEASWPAAFCISGASIAFSTIPFKPSRKSKS